MKHKSLIRTGFFVVILSLIGLLQGQAQQNIETNAPIDIQITNPPVIFKGIYGNRSKGGSKPAMRVVCGGSDSERAVMRCLRWLKAVQNDDGSWGGDDESPTMATGLALLTFLSHGETPSSAEFGISVEKALKYLTSIQNEGGTFRAKAQFPAIEHGIATRSLCEAYDMTRIPILSNKCEKAVEIIVKAQRPSGLWSIDYSTGKGSDDDMEASVWQVFALKSAILYGMNQDELRPVLQAALKAIAMSIESNTQGRTNAAAVSCLQLTGHGRDNAAKVGLKALEGLTMNWKLPEYENPIYQWHSVTMVKFWNGGTDWKDWNKSFMPTLVSNQTVESVVDSKETGYWVSPGKNERYGRIYSTSLCCLMLELYYRYLPLMKPHYAPGIQDQQDSTNDVIINLM